MPVLRGRLVRGDVEGCAGLPPDGYPGPRAAATASLLPAVPGETSTWHTVRSDELWLWHRGGPLDLLLGGDGEAPDAEGAVTVWAPPWKAASARRSWSPATSGSPPARPATEKSWSAAWWPPASTTRTSASSATGREPRATLP